MSLLWHLMPPPAPLAKCLSSEIGVSCNVAVSFWDVSFGPEGCGGPIVLPEEFQPFSPQHLPFPPHLLSPTFLLSILFLLCPHRPPPHVARRPHFAYAMISDGSVVHWESGGETRSFWRGESKVARKRKNGEKAKKLDGDERAIQRAF